MQIDWIMTSVIGTGGTFLIGILLAIIFRRVVPTNEVHIIQTNKDTRSYGKDTNNGNSYYEWPSWIPIIGVERITMPVSVFDLNLNSYEAYDSGRLPFVVDITAFFRIDDTNRAAQRVENFQELKDQLKSVVQGAVRTILATSDIEEIMEGRSTFGEKFTKEVDEQLSSWGVKTVKNIELMDIRDASDSHVIHNIMAKKKSHIEMESRTEVAKNKKMASIAEIDAKQEVDVRNQEATEIVGLRTIKQQQELELKQQQKLQNVAKEEEITAETKMKVNRVEVVRVAEINRDRALVSADEEKQTGIIRAEGRLEAKKREAQAIQVEGEARADAKKQMELAPVAAQIDLAKEIGNNDGYQKYLVTIRNVEAMEKIGVEQAAALQRSNIKIIANTGEGPASGLESVRNLFSSKNGVQIGAMLEGLSQTEKGAQFIDRFIRKNDRGNGVDHPPAEV